MNSAFLRDEPAVDAIVVVVFFVRVGVAVRVALVGVPGAVVAGGVFFLLPALLGLRIPRCTEPRFSLKKSRGFRSEY